MRHGDGTGPAVDVSLDELQPAGAVDYTSTPHLGQWELRRKLTGLVHGTLDDVRARGLPLRVLELGAGHGGYTDTLLAAGAEVTLAESSEHVLSDTAQRYAGNPNLTLKHSPVLNLRGIDGGFTVVVALSVLHHVPDYLGLLAELTARLNPGGALVTMQDPRWYPRAGDFVRAADRAAYLAWRLSRGEVKDGLISMRRRLRREYPPSDLGALTYFHVVRNGVDEQAVAEQLGLAFASVRLATYWSNHFGGVASLAGRAGLRNTFAVRATGYGC